MKLGFSQCADVSIECHHTCLKSLEHRLIPMVPIFQTLSAPKIISEL